MKFNSKFLFCNAVLLVFQQGDALPNWAGMVQNFSTCIFLGAGLGVMDQFCGLHARPILRHLISSCGDTLKTLFKRPL
jgi:hypothetical protein